jgi:hypothetical protein
VSIRIFQSGKGHGKMLKEHIRIYKNRWNLVANAESKEIREAHPELLLRQTLSIWDLASSLNFFEHEEMPNTMWSQLQKAWMKQHA